MQTLSSITNYRHSNVFVQQAKIKKAIADLMLIRAQQAYANRIFISYQDIDTELTKARKLLEQTEEKIRNIEVNCFAYSEIVEAVYQSKPRYVVQSWVCDWGIYDTINKCYIGKPLSSETMANQIYNVMFQGLTK